MYELKKLWGIISFIIGGFIALKSGGGIVGFIVLSFVIMIGGMIFFAFLYSLPAKNREAKARSLKEKIKIFSTDIQIDYKVIKSISVTAETYEDALSKILIKAEQKGADAIIYFSSDGHTVNTSFIDNSWGSSTRVNETESTVNASGTAIKFLSKT